MEAFFLQRPSLLSAFLWLKFAIAVSFIAIVPQNSLVFTMDDSNFNCYHYSPSLAAAIVFIVLFVAVTVLHIFRLLRTRTWYFTALVVGGFCKLPF